MTNGKIWDVVFELWEMFSLWCATNLTTSLGVRFGRLLQYLLLDMLQGLRTKRPASQRSVTTTSRGRNATESKRRPSNDVTCTLLTLLLYSSRWEHPLHGVSWDFMALYKCCYYYYYLLERNSNNGSLFFSSATAHVARDIGIIRDDTFKTQ